jgi:SAM-dependent MidA family methyltransferase
LFILAYSEIIRGVIIPSHLSHLPAPSPDAQACSDQLATLIANEIRQSGCWIDFARFMELALYAPGLGYYSAGSAKLGASGDFVTAPELSPLFAQCIARQLAQLHAGGLRNVLELGAGSGALAAGLLNEMAAQGLALERYWILELSGDLRERQHATIAQIAPALLARVQWLDTLPAAFEGVILANEVLDATPVHRVRVTKQGIEEIGVTVSGGGPSEACNDIRFTQACRPAQGALLDTAAALGLPGNYETEINVNARALVASLGRTLTRGVLLFIDYGFPAREFYHPQRNRGTLMCHYRHHAHDDPFAFVGLQDITAHVDFSTIAAAAVDAGAAPLGYTSQAQFLINCGVTELLAQTPASDARAYAPLAAQAQKLLSPAEMGELFKVIALGKGAAAPLLGFARGDKAHTL